MTEPAPTPEMIRERFDFQLAPDEVPLKVYTRHWIVLVYRAGLFLILLLLSVIILIFSNWLARQTFQGLNWVIVLFALSVVMFYCYYGYTDWRNDVLLVSNQRLVYIDQTIFLYRTLRETLLSNVQNVHFSSQGLLASLLRYGSLLIETAAREMDISFGPIPNPRKAQQEIMSLLEQLRVTISRQRIEQALRRHVYGEETPETPALAGLPAPSRPRWFLIPPNPLIEGENITWHKHWFFLVRRLFWYVLLLVLILGSFFVLPMLPFSVPGWAYLIPLSLIPFLLLTIICHYQIWKGDIYILTATQMHDIYRTPWGLFGEECRTGELSRIQSISLRKPGVLAWILNFGDVQIQTAGAEDFSFSRVPRPEEVQREIYRRQEQARLREQERERERIAEYLAVYRRLERERLQE